MEKKFSWKKRYNIVVIMFFVGLILMFDRAVISTALPLIAKDLQLSPVSMGIVLSVFFNRLRLGSNSRRAACR